MSAIVFGQEQAMMLDIASRFFRDRWPIEQVRDQIGTETGFDPALWTEMAELGWAGLAIPETHGGTGLGVMELVTVVEPMGRHLFASPFVPTQIAVQALLAGGNDQQQTVWLPRLREGAVAALATVEEDASWDLESPRCAGHESGSKVTLEGRKTFVNDGAVADVFVVTLALDGEPAVALLEKSAVPAAALEREIVIDETRRSFRFTLDGLEVDRADLITGSAARRAIAAIRTTGWLLTAAEACGGTAGALAVILEYLKARRQFGQLIGGYQALKHPTVDVLCALERARSHLYHAATVFGGTEAEVALRMAKADASDAFAFAGDRAIQFHGAFGFTYECDAQLFLRRALWCQYQFGDALHHRERLAEVLL